MSKYAIQMGRRLYVCQNPEVGEGSPFARPLYNQLGGAFLFDTQSAAIRAIEVLAIARKTPIATGYQIVEVDEVAHAGETTEVRRIAGTDTTEGTISTRYEIDRKCSLGQGVSECDTLLEVLDVVRQKYFRCHECGDVEIYAIDTVLSPIAYTRVIL